MATTDKVEDAKIRLIIRKAMGGNTLAPDELKVLLDAAQNYLDLKAQDRKTERKAGGDPRKTRPL